MKRVLQFLCFLVVGHSFSMRHRKEQRGKTTVIHQWRQCDRCDARAA